MVEEETTEEQELADDFEEVARFLLVAVFDLGKNKIMFCILFYFLKSQNAGTVSKRVLQKEWLKEQVSLMKLW